MFTVIGRVIKFGWQNFYRHGILSFSTIFILVMIVSLVTSLFLLKGVTDFVIASLQEKVDISVYFNEGATEDDILHIKDEIMHFPGVNYVEYVSCELALEKFTEQHQNNPTIIESIEEVGANPLLASLSIKANQAAQYARVASFLEVGPFQDLVEKVNYHQNQTIIDKLFSLTADINRAGMTFSLVLAIVAVLITFNTIRLAIYNTKNEISVMKLVGASNSFIRWPFMVQGMIIGTVSAIISALIIGTLLFFCNIKIMQFFPGLDMWSYFMENLDFILLIQLVTGIGLGTISSLIAVRKYLGN